MPDRPETVGRPPPTAAKANILLVDDNPANLMALRAVLDDLDQNLVEARSGEEALIRLRGHEFAVVLLDVQMPGLDGFETAKLMRQESTRRVPIIFLTGFESDRFHIEQAYSLGAVDYLVKPLAPVVVRAKVAGFVELFEKTRQIQRQAEELRAAERQRFDRSAEEQREWFRVTLASIGDAVITTDTNGLVTFMNAVAQRLTGWAEADAKGQRLETVFRIEHEQTRQPVENPVAAVLKDGRVVGLGNHTVLVAKNGTVRPIADSAAPIRASNGTLLGVVLTFRDVTEQRRNEREVRQSEARKSAILETALDCIITMDHEGKVVEFNPAAEKTFGFSRSDVIGRELVNLVIPPSLRDRHNKGMAHYLATGEGPVLGQRLELPAMRADGSLFIVEIAINRISVEGAPLFTAYLRDVSDRMKSEQYRNARLVVTQVLAHATSVSEASVGVLRAVCESLGWDVGFFWSLDADAKVLRCREGWHIPGSDTLEFEAAARRHEFGCGEGLPGELWATGKPKWIPNFPHEVNFPRVTLASKAGLHAAFGCPIVVGNHTLGVVEFFSREIREPDPDLLELMNTVCGQVGQFLERKTAEEQLRRSERELADFFENAAVGLHWVGPDGIILRANKAELSLLGYQPEEYVGHHIAEFHADQDVVGDILERLKSRERLNDYPARMRCKEGSVRDVLIHSSALFEDGRFVHTRCITRDVTDRRRAEIALEESEERLRLLANTIPQLAWMARPDGFIFWYNRRWYEYTGTTPDEVEGWGWRSVQDPEMLPKVQEQWARSLATGEPFDMVFPLKGADGKFRPFLTRVNPLWDRDGRIVYWFGTNTDVSEIKSMEEALRDADRRKDEFLATLAHELRNPLAPIRNALQILKMPRADAAMVGRSRDMMERQVEHLVRLVDDLLDVSRVMRGKIDLRRERVELAAVVARAVETVQPLVDAQGHQLSVRLPADSLPVDADPVRLAQVVGNLLTNAAKYTEPNGRIWLAAAGREGGEAVLSVRDSGIGIAPELLPHVFDLFVQADHATDRSQGGLGIGLTLVKNLVGMHGGTVEARSAGLGHGCEFEVRLPLAATGTERPGDSEGGAETRPASSTTGHSLLVVDDNRDAADSLAELLRLHGHEVRVAHDGPAALALAHSYRPDLIFLDIGMPGMDGYEVARRLRKTPGLGHTVLAALTGWGQQEDRRRTADAGFDHHLVKPLEPKALEGLLAELERPQAR
ncbi:MAG: PAS domain S-box protein [Planctomycetes bacterium]|nr:PAS domain S-box protein [Planctomycetota bacterium]